MITINEYIFLRWSLDSYEYGFEFTDFQWINLLFYNVFWYYLLALVIIVAVWKWFGLPQRIIGDTWKNLVKKMHYTNYNIDVKEKGEK